MAGPRVNLKAQLSARAAVPHGLRMATEDLRRFVR